MRAKALHRTHGARHTHTHTHTQEGNAAWLVSSQAPSGGLARGDLASRGCWGGLMAGCAQHLLANAQSPRTRELLFVITLDGQQCSLAAPPVRPEGHLPVSSGRVRAGAWRSGRAPAHCTAPVVHAADRQTPHVPRSGALCCRCSASPHSDENLMVWNASVLGPDESVWEGGVFSLRCARLLTLRPGPSRTRRHPAANAALCPVEL